MKIYVVVGAYGTGEWDHTEWDVAYYDNEDAAKCQERCKFHPA